VLKCVFVRNDIVGEWFAEADEVPVLYNPPRVWLGTGYSSGYPPVFGKFTSGAIAS
jgi:hypothetical protein